VDVASELFRKHGFDGIGVADIMDAAGLTHGGFYGQFDSKDHLAAEACARAINRSRWESWMDRPVERRLEAFVRGYLTPRHRDDRVHGCLFAAVGSDIVRQPRTVRRAFTEGFRAKIDLLRSLVPGRSAAARREKALATMARVVGALIV
jgi:TetR/AcrR family transcriptional repressor of nem operon